MKFKGEKITWSNIKAYVQGNYRYFLLRKYPWLFRRLVRSHIREQIGFRLEYMTRECFVKGSCIKCGCDVPNLQMANKPCKGMCYPDMMNKKDWESFNRKGIRIVSYYGPGQPGNIFFERVKNGLRISNKKVSYVKHPDETQRHWFDKLQQMSKI